MGASNVTLYAVWTLNPTYTVTYDGNGGAGGAVPADPNTYAQGSTITVLGNTGQHADVVAFSTTPDITRLVKDGIVARAGTRTPTRGSSPIRWS